MVLCSSVVFWKNSETGQEKYKLWSKLLHFSEGQFLIYKKRDNIRDLSGLLWVFITKKLIYDIQQIYNKCQLPTFQLSKPLCIYNLNGNFST